MINRIPPEDVHEHLCPETRRLGVITYGLISQWDRWVKRRVEQVELISDAAARRRLSVDFRVHRTLFGEGVVKEGHATAPRVLHYVPLTLLHKAPVANFDLRDESQKAIPLLTKRKTAAVGAAALVTATQSMVIQKHFSSRAQGEFAETVRERKVGFEEVHIPDEIQADFINLCVFPFDPSVIGAEETTSKEIRLEMAAKTVGAEQKDADEWNWSWDDEICRWKADVDYETWLWGICDEPTLSSLIFDLTRLYMVSAPIDADPGRRRILKLEYEEHYSDPGLKIVAGVRDRVSDKAAWLRRKEDELEGLEPEERVSQSEWTLPRSAMNKNQDRPSFSEAVLRGIGWQGKPISFTLPNVGLGGTFHLEIDSPAGTQLRRAELSALDKKDDEKEVEPKADIARRYARNVTRAHLYLGGDRSGTWGQASMVIKPMSSTVIRGAAIAACVITVLAAFALAFGGSLEKDSQTAIAILLLAPGAVAAVAGQPSAHSVTSKMVFGLRLIALSVAGVAVVAAALIGGHMTFCDQPVVWTALLLVAISLTAVLLVAWRLAGRDWPRNLRPAAGAGHSPE